MEISSMAKEVKKTTRKTAGTITKSAPKARVRAMPTEDEIRARAYQIFLARNGAPGDAHSDWVQAERELMEEFAR